MIVNEIELDGELYKKIGKYWVDEHYCTVNAIILNRIYEEITKRIPENCTYEEIKELSTQLDEEELFTPFAVKIYEKLVTKINFSKCSYDYLNDLALRLKELKLYAQAITVIKYLVGFVGQQMDEDEWNIEAWIRAEQGLYAVLMSCQRGQGDAQGAIETYKSFCDKNDSYFLTSYICTSAAAAYCDLKDYKNAIRLCDQAYRLQGGSTGKFNELSLVYKRIESETGKSILLLKKEFGEHDEIGY